MKKIKYIYILLIVSILFIPKVYAFSYDITTEVTSTSVVTGSLSEIKVSLSNIEETTAGITNCLMNISFDDNILLNAPVKTLESWSMTTGSSYLFDTSKAVNNKSDMFIIPVKINGNGNVTLSGIVCTADGTKQELNNKIVNFTVTSSDNADLTTESVSTDADLSDITLSVGDIDFDPAVTEYSVEVSDFSKFEVTPLLTSDKASYVIEKNVGENGNTVVLNVTAENGNVKTYTIYVKEVKDSGTETADKKNKTYIPIFVGIIALLVIVNIFRIIKNKKK